MSTTAQKPGQADPVVAFIIGLSIILLASILNAAGLNLTKLDHVRRQIQLQPLLLRYVLGAHQCNSEASKKEGLDATTMAAWHDPLHVRLYSFVVHSFVTSQYLPASLN